LKFNHTQYPIPNTQYRPHGQSFIELLVAISIGTILIGGSVTLMGVSLKSYAGIRKHLQANVLIRESAEVIQILARYDWHSIYDLTESTAESTTDYKITATSTTWLIEAGQEEKTVNKIPYKRYFQVYNVNRNAESGNIADTGDDDPSAQKITVILEYDKHDNNYISSSSVSFYLTRSENNKVFHQFDWSGGSGVNGPIPNPDDKYATSTNVYASEQITIATTTSDGWLESSILDTGVSDGAGFNSAFASGTWDGIGSVKIQFAFSDSASSTWDYYAYLTTNAWSTSPNPDWSLVKELLENTSLPFATAGSASPQNKRYIRYKVNLSTTGTSPTINDIIINWSP